MCAPGPPSWGSTSTQPLLRALGPVAQGFPSVTRVPGTREAYYAVVVAVRLSLPSMIFKLVPSSLGIYVF